MTTYPSDTKRFLKQVLTMNCSHHQGYYSYCCHGNHLSVIAYRVGHTCCHGDSAALAVTGTGLGSSGCPWRRLGWGRRSHLLSR